MQVPAEQCRSSILHLFLTRYSQGPLLLIVLQYISIECYNACSYHWLGFLNVPGQEPLCLMQVEPSARCILLEHAERFRSLEYVLQTWAILEPWDLLPSNKCVSLLFLFKLELALWYLEAAVTVYLQ